MRRAFLIAFLMSMAATAGAQHIKRLLLFANDSTNAALHKQLEALRADSAGVVEHNIWIAVFDSPRKMRRVYEYHQVGTRPFVLVLVGTGGEEWFRSEEPVPPTMIFKVIEEKERAEKSTTQTPKGHSP